MPHRVICIYRATVTEKSVLYKVYRFMFLYIAYISWCWLEDLRLNNLYETNGGDLCCIENIVLRHLRLIVSNTSSQGSELEYCVDVIYNSRIYIYNIYYLYCYYAKLFSFIHIYVAISSKLIEKFNETFESYLYYLKARNI